jgi:predicted small secreted protein
MRRIILPAVILVTALSLAGCSAASGASSSAQSQGTSGAAAPSKGTADTTSLVSPATEQRQVITTTDVVIRAKDPVAAGDSAAHIVEADGGRVDDRTQTSATKHRTASAQLTLRVPQDQLTDTLDKLKALGHVQSLHESADDVTTKSVDLAAKITALQTSITRLLSLEAKAKNTDDLIALEDDISSRQGDLDSLTAQKRYLDDQVAMSTVNLSLVAPAAVPAAAPANPAGAFGAGLAGFAAFFTALFVVLSYLLPWLVLAAAITFGTIFLVRWRRKRKAGAVPTQS